MQSLSLSSFFILSMKRQRNSIFFFFNDTATTEIYTLSLHDALPICGPPARDHAGGHQCRRPSHRQHQEGSIRQPEGAPGGDRKSTRLNSSHGYISYAVFCLKKKKKYRKTNKMTQSDK